MGAGRPALQAGVEESLPHLARELQLRVRQLLDDDWGSLEPDTQALGLTIGVPDEAWAWLASRFPAHPGPVLDLALAGARWTTRFGRAGGRVVRVPVRVESPQAPVVPLPSFWRSLRGAVDEHPHVREAFVAAVAQRPPDDPRVRAGVAHVLWGDPARWTARDEFAALRVVDPDTGVHLLLALLRQAPRAVASREWPPPIGTLNELSDPAFFAACRWYPKEQGDEAARVRQSCRRSLGQVGRERDEPPAPTASDKAVRDLPQLLGEPAEVIRLAAFVPHPRHLERALELQPAAGTLAFLLHDYLVTRWRSQLAGAPRGALELEVRPGVAPLKRAEVAALQGALNRGNFDTLAHFLSRFTEEALERCAAHRFLDWVADGCSGRRPGAVTCMRFARSPNWSEVVGRLLPRGPEARSERLVRGCLGALRHQRTRASIDGLSRFLLRERYGPHAAIAHHLLQEIAEEEGMSVDEMLERFFLEVTDPPRGCEPRLAYGPSIILVEPEPQGPLALDGLARGTRAHRPVALPHDWAQASAALRGLKPRLERLITDGPPMSMVHFTETWAMHPALRVVAGNLVWGAWDGPRRVGFFVPGRLQPFAPAEHHQIRLVHPIELTAEELDTLRALIPGPQPIVQLERPVYGGPWLVSGERHLTLTPPGPGPCEPPWRGSVLRSFFREGRGWYASVRFEREARSRALLRVRVGEAAQPWAARLMSEAAREVARWIGSPDLVPSSRARAPGVFACRPGM